METATLQLPKDLIEAAIKSQVSTAIAAALGGHKQVIDCAIRGVLQAKVDRNGGKDTYGNGQEFISWLCNNAIEKCVREVCEEEIAKIKPQIKEAIVAMLQQKKSPLLRKLAEAMVDGFGSSMANKFRTTIEIKAD